MLSVNLCFGPCSHSFIPPPSLLPTTSNQLPFHLEALFELSQAAPSSLLSGVSGAQVAVMGTIDLRPKYAGKARVGQGGWKKPMN